MKAVTTHGRTQIERNLIGQFLLTLRSMYLKVKPDQPSGRQQEFVVRIDELLAGDESWANAYEVEQLLVYLYDKETFELELARRSVEAKRLLPPDVCTKYEQEIGAANDEKKRAILLRLVNDLQWQYAKMQTRQEYVRSTTARNGSIFVISIGLFAAVFAGVQLTVGFHGVAPAVLIAAAAGFWGASFSMLLGLRNRLNSTSFKDLKVMHRWPQILSRAIIGLGAAMILLFIIQSGFVSGVAVPVLQPQSSEERVQTIISVVRAVAANSVTSPPGSNSQQVQDAIKILAENVQAVLPVNGSDVNQVLTSESKKVIAIAYGSATSAVQDEAAQKLARALHDVVRGGLVMDQKSLALLVVWSFLAGFSEKLVPNLLTRTEESVASKP